ncbi:MAG: hypothetical protein ACI8TA_000151 [Cyclobacteriaceae bacterium]|jgi:hypothetical protein
MKVVKQENFKPNEPLEEFMAHITQLTLKKVNFEVTSIILGTIEK